MVRRDSDPFLGDDFVESSKLPQYYATISGTLCVFCGGAAIAWSSPATPMLLSGTGHLKLSQEECSWVSSLLAAGALLGAIPAGPAANVLGRKFTLLCQGVLFLASWVMILLARSVTVLYIARIIAGIAVGASTSLSPLYISEIAEENIKGSLCSYTQLMIVSGVLYCYVLGAFCSYKTMTLLCAVIPVVFLVFFLCAPETPTYYMIKGREKRAQRAIEWLRGSDFDASDEMRVVKSQTEDNKGKGTTSCLKRSSVKATAICLCLMSFQQLSGVNIIIFNSTEIFSSVGNGLNASYATIILGLTQVLATFLAASLLNRTERRELLFISSFLMAVSLLALGVYLNMESDFNDIPYVSWVPLILILIYMVAFSLGFGPVPFVMLGELLPYEIKSTVSGLSIAANWATTFFVVKSYAYLIDNIGSDRTFWLFGIFCLLISLFVVAFVVETKGKDSETIQNELENGYPSGYQRI